MKIHQNMPHIVRHLCWTFDAWVVGSTAKAIVNNELASSDWDLIVPIHNWLGATLSCADLSPCTNSFGGWKITLDNASVDVWPDTLDGFILRKQFAKESYAVHPKSGMVVKIFPGA